MGEVEGEGPGALRGADVGMPADIANCKRMEAKSALSNGGDPFGHCPDGPRAARGTGWRGNAPPSKKRKYRAMTWRVWPGFGMMLGLAVLVAPMAASAQSEADVILVRDAIRAELARPGSGIPPQSIHVSEVRFEGDFATADVTDANSSSPVVFVKLSDGRWQVVLVGTDKLPETCQHVGFPSGSQMCPN